jgi:S1-C subfamily serine protease
LKANDIEIKKIEDLLKLLGHTLPGISVNFSIIRGNQAMSVNILLESAG